jgi:hypothetical protein
MYLRVLSSLFLVCVSIMTASAQPPGGDPPPATIPISGIEWLLVAGGLYGARMVKRRMKN